MISTSYSTSRSRRPTISVLASDLSGNPVVRMDPILKVLEKRYDLQTIGPVSEAGVFPPYRDCRKYETYNTVNLPQFLFEMAKLSRGIVGQAVLSFKPRIESFGLALFHCLPRMKPLVLDIEDWEMAQSVSEWHKMQFFDFMKRYIFHGWKMSIEPKFLLPFDLLARLNFPKFVVSDFLKKKYGGMKLYHGTDTDIFNPELFEIGVCRDKFAIPRQGSYILFAGTPRPHKGLDDLLKALALIDSDKKIKLLTAGGNPFECLCPEDHKLAINRIIPLGHLPHGDMPALLATADMVVLPQKNSPVSAAQVPAKVFEAMAMAKPIIATALSDLPVILSGCGSIVKPGNVTELAAAISEMASGKDRASNMGKTARIKCIELYSHRAMERVLYPLFDRLLNKDGSH